MIDDIDFVRKNIRELINDFKRVSQGGSKLKLFNSVFEIEFSGSKTLLNDESSLHLLDVDEPLDNDSEVEEEYYCYVYYFQ